MFDCPRFGKMIGGCRFEPRYDTPKADRFGSDAFWRSSTITRHSDGRTTVGDNVPAPMQVYVRDVCTRCGRTVEREKAKA